MNNLFALLVTLVPTAAMATDYPFSEVECGDHWFEVSAEIDADTDSATVYFSGDSNPGRGPVSATVQTTGTDVVISLQDGSGESLVIDGSDAVHNIFWGELRSAGRTEYLGLCSTN